MKQILIILFLVSCFIGKAATYYVATTGDDNDPGTLSEPWVSWKKAIETISAGDTVYFRGGTYTPVDDASGTYASATLLEATVEDPTCLFNYSDEVPILDGSLREGSSLGYNTAIGISYSDHVKVKGLTIRNFYQSANALANGHSQSQLATGYGFYGCTNLSFENCTAHNIGGRGWYCLSMADQTDTSYWNNCDAYDCVDSLSYYVVGEDTVDNAGNGADGYFIQLYMQYPEGSDTGTVYDSYALIDSCRAWRCTDDGFNLSGSAYMEMKNCWSFNNPYYDLAKSEGNGIKLAAPLALSKDTIYRKLINCIAANTNFGFDHNNGLNNYWPRSQIYNCFSYNNLNGIVLQNITRDDSINVLFNTYKNHLSYLDNSPILNVPKLQGRSDYEFTESHNTWDVMATSPGWVITDTVTVTAADFVSLDVDELDDARQSDHSLPEVDFGKLAAGSDLIDAGVNVGLTYEGLAPDIGWFEFPDTVVIEADSVNIFATGDATTITTNNGTLQMIDTVWPLNASFPDVTWYSIDGTGSGTIIQDGLVQAVSNGTDTIRGIAQDGTGEYDDYILTYSNQDDNTIPTVITSVTSGTHSTQATSGGNVTATGGAAVTARGVCWSTSINPTLSDRYTINGSGTGSYISLIKWMNNSTTYYVRAYATNSEGTAYGDNRQIWTTAYSTLRGSGNTYRLNNQTVVF